MTCAVEDNTGRFLTVRNAFVRHFREAVRSIRPVTPNLQEFVQKPLKFRLMIAEDRMIDKVEEMLELYQKSPNGGEFGLNAPLPVILMAFAKDATTSDVSYGRASPNITSIQNVVFEYDGVKYVYNMQTTNLENRVQVAFIGHDSETVRAMTAQVRLWLQRFRARSFPITWKFGGFDFDLTGMIDDTNFSDTVVDIDSRTNLSILAWDFSIRYQLPFLSAPEGAALDDKCKLQGFNHIKDIVVKIKDNNQHLVNQGYIYQGQDSQKYPIGQWNIEDIPNLTEDLKKMQEDN